MNDFFSQKYEFLLHITALDMQFAFHLNEIVVHKTLIENNLLLKHKGSFQVGESPEVQVFTAATHKKFISAKY